MKRVCMLAFAALMTAVMTTTSMAQLAGDPERGGQIYRNCVSCHALQPGVHSSGPSLAGLWGQSPGSAKDFKRYSKELRGAKFVWDADTLNAWIADPGALVPGTFMNFRGIQKDQHRADLIAFLKIAMAPGGAEVVIGRNLVPREYTEGQIPSPVKSLPSSAQVKQVRHCGDSYFVTTADGRETPYWEMNVRLKLDTRTTGPAANKPMIVGAGMVGDRVSIVFSNVAEIPRFVVEKC